jgi:hypothetical protein
MIQIAIIGIGAGAAAALLFASVISGSWLSIPLFYLAPLPIMIAGLGWSHWAAMTAAIAGAIGLGAVFGTVFLLAFAAGAGFPAWCLGYLAMLARPVASTNGSGQGAASFEWYPPGRLVVWAAVLGALVVRVAIPNFGVDADSFRAGLRDALNTIMRVNNGTPARTGSNTERLLEILVNAIPPAAAVLATITNLLNLWLAARVVKFSGRLARPWPQLSSMIFPPLMIAALGVAIIFELSGRHAWHCRQHRRGKFALGLWHARICGASRHHSRNECTSARAQHHLCRCISARLADACPLSARTDRYGDRIARSRIRKTWTPYPFLNMKYPTKIQIEE